eukprot:INCI6071.1.p2 GENE.INCI6071.1~~INCI6071.1.p2  ORF type:complete len:563 (-),score=168.15 INCI6071.1:2269-3957(-)
MASSYLQKLDDWVFNDQKTITYTHLCNDLQVPADIAKRMLYHFCMERPGKAHSTFCISGLRKQDGFEKENLCFSLCSNDALEETKSKFKQVVSVHVYGVSPHPLTKKNRSAALVAEDNASWSAAIADRSAESNTLVRQNSGSNIVNKTVKVAEKLSRSAPLAPRVQPGVVRTASAPGAMQETDTSPTKKVKRSSSTTAVPSSKGKRNIGAMFAAADARAEAAGGKKKKSKPSIGELFAARKSAAASKPTAKAAKASKPKKQTGPKAKGSAEATKAKSASAKPSASKKAAPKKRKKAVIEDSSDDEDGDVSEPTPGAAAPAKRKISSTASNSESGTIDLAEEEEKADAAPKQKRTRKKSSPSKQAQQEESAEKSTKQKKKPSPKKRQPKGLRELDSSEVFQLEMQAKEREGAFDGPAFDNRTEADLEKERQLRKQQQEEEAQQQNLAEFDGPAKGTLGAMFKVQASQQAKKKKKKKRLEERTKTTPDGFLLVEKVWVEYTDDEEEEDDASKSALAASKKANREDAAVKTTQKKKAAAATKAKAKASKDKGGKQRSMMSFFAKK